MWEKDLKHMPSAADINQDVHVFMGTGQIGGQAHLQIIPRQEEIQTYKIITYL